MSNVTLADRFDANLVQVDPVSITKKQQPACARCHERKVRCRASDLPDSRSCKNCLAAGETCRRHVDRRARRIQTPSAQINVPPDSTTEHASPSIDGASRVPHVRPASSASSASRVLVTDLSPEGPLISDTGSDTSQMESASEMTSELGTSIDFISSQGPRVIVSPRLDFARTAPPPIGSLDADSPGTLGSYAPLFRSSPENPQSANVLENGGAKVSAALYALADFACTRRLKIDTISGSPADHEEQAARLDEGDMEYLRAKGAFDLPPWHLQEELVNEFFAEVHPTAPVINRAEFLNDFYSHRVKSRLLLFAIFTAGARACRNPLLLDSKATNHSSAQRFYKATKALLDTGYEQSKLVRIQALSLITWWWDKKDDGGRNMRASIVDAINTAQSLGLHRWDQYPQGDPVLRGLWKRILWTCVGRDVGVAVAHGLPTMLRPSDFDIHPLTADDFDEEPGVPLHLRKYPYKPVEVAFSIEFIKVMEAQRYIHCSFYVSQRLHQESTGPITEREERIGPHSAPAGCQVTTTAYVDNYNDTGLKMCRKWYEHISDIVKYDVDDIQGHCFWPAFLHILHFTNIMLRFREKSISKPIDDRAEAERKYCQTRGIAAATMVSKIMRNVHAHDHILKFTGQLTHSLFNCLIFFLIEGQSLNPNVRRDARAKYSLCLHMLFGFSRLWASASLIHRLFEALQTHMETRSDTMSSLLSEKEHTPLPGLSISSDITNSYMNQLLATGFYDNNSDVSESNIGNFPTNHAPSLSTQSFVNNAWYNLQQSLDTDISMDLNVTEWLGFFELGDTETL